MVWQKLSKDKQRPICFILYVRSLGHSVGETRDPSLTINYNSNLTAYLPHLQTVQNTHGKMCHQSSPNIFSNYFVSVPPRVVARESEVSVRSGSSAELECVAHGNPPPTIRWRKLVGVSSDTSVISSDTNQKNNRNKVITKISLLDNDTISFEICLYL